MLDQIMAALEGIKPAPICASSRVLCGTNEAMSWSVGDQDYVVAHPTVWSQVPLQVGEASSIWRVTIHEFDRPGPMRDRIIEAMAQAMETQASPTAATTI